MGEVHFLPPIPGRCPLCGGKHKKGDAHDEKSAYYQMRKRRREKRLKHGAMDKQG